MIQNNVQFLNRPQPRFGLLRKSRPKGRAVLQGSDLSQLEPILATVCQKLRSGQFAIQFAPGYRSQRMIQASLSPVPGQSSDIKTLKIEIPAGLTCTAGESPELVRELAAAKDVKLVIETDKHVLTYSGKTERSSQLVVLRDMVADACVEKRNDDDAKTRQLHRQSETARARITRQVLSNLKP